MDSVLVPVVELYRYLLQPAAPFSWFGLPISTLDVAATVRLCVAMRQVKEAVYRAHVEQAARSRRAIKGKDKAREAGVPLEDGDVPQPPPIEERSFVRDAATTLLVVYGGEIISGPLLGQPPSFMASGVWPVFFTLTQVLVEYLPAVPTPGLTNELPLSFVDALSRAMLLCTMIPPSVVKHTTPAIATSPWSLLLTSLLTANGGFFLANAFSMFAPHGIRLQTPPELLPYGWTTTDLWAAPLVTGIYALLTHAQPFWADLHGVLSGALGGATEDGVVKPLDSETARAACAMILAGMFATRATKNFGGLVGKRA